VKKRPDKTPESRPVLIEVPKPVNQMTQVEKDAFVDEILDAIDGGIVESCPACKSKTGLREILYGLLDGPVDERKYAIGGCCISDNDPTVKCIECEWKGEFVNNIGPGPMIREQVKSSDSSVLERLQVEILLGIPKEKSKFAPLTAELEATWDQISKEAKEIEAMGGTIDIVSEIPDIEILAGRSVRTSTNKNPYHPYQVTFEGSSLLGKSNGVENFKIVHAKLSELRDKGLAKCYTRWCKACAMYGLKLENDVTGHFLKISFPNVIALAKKMEIDWNWERPESEWAKESGDPKKVFKSLVERKSKPVFYVRLESEEYVNMLLGGQSERSHSRFVWDSPEGISVKCADCEKWFALSEGRESHKCRVRPIKI